MARLILELAAAALAAPASASNVTQWRALIDEASARFGLPASWIARVIAAESGGRTILNGLPIRSSKGAIGLMQLMPATWSDMRRRLGLGSDPDDPRDNILAGTLYLRLMYDRFGFPGLFGAYNAGPGRYADWLAGRQPLPSETLTYLAKMPSGNGIARRVPTLVIAAGADGLSDNARMADPIFAIRKPAP